jgi:hypothetical protein
VTTEEQLQSHADLLGSISRSLDRLANTVIAHDAQIDALIIISEENARNWKNLERQWQAYLNTLPRN